MGSFNYTCMISDLTIEKGEDVVLFILQDKRLKKVRTNLIYDIHHYYDIVSLPIYGVYNQYGFIDDILENQTTQGITNYFGIDYKEVLQILREGYSPYHTCGTLYDNYSYLKNNEKLSSNLSSMEKFKKLLEFSDNIHHFKQEEDTFIHEFTTMSAGKDEPGTLTITFKEKGITLDKFFLGNHSITEFASFQLEDLLSKLEMNHGFNIFYKKEAKKLVSLVQSLSFVMIKEDVYTKLVELGQQDISWYEDDVAELVENKKQFWTEQLSLYKELLKKKAELEPKFKALSKDDEKYEEIRDAFIDTKVELIHISNGAILTDKYGNDTIDRRFEYNRLFKEIYAADTVLEDEFIKAFTDLLWFEQAAHSLGKYYRLPSNTPQFKTPREKKYISFLNEITTSPEEDEDE